MSQKSVTGPDGRTVLAIAGFSLAGILVAGWVIASLIRCGTVVAPTMGKTGQCAPSMPVFGITVGIIVVLAVAGLIIGATWYGRYRESEKYLIKQLNERDGLARASEVRKKLGEKPALRSATTLRPSLAKTNQKEG